MASNNIFGNLTDWLSGGNYTNAQNLGQNATGYYSGLQAPSIAQQQVNLQQMVNAGQLTPAQAQTIALGPSAMANVQANSGAVNAEEGAIQQAENVVNAKGMTPTEQAQLAQVENQQNTINQGEQQAIQQNAAQRGEAGSGTSLAAQMQAQQSGATNANANALNVNAQAQQNALNALQMQNSMGSNLANQSFSEAAQQAQAIDAVNRYNAMNAQNTSNLNTQNANQAQQYNLQNQQNINNQNTNIANNGQLYNSGLYQKNYQDQLAQAQGEAGTSEYNANLDYKIGQNQQGYVGGLLQGGASSLANYGGSLFSGAGAGGSELTGAGGSEAMAGGAADAGDAGAAGDMGYAADAAMMAAQGGRVPGNPIVNANSVLNDIVPIKASPGEVVLPRSVSSSPQKSAMYVNALNKMGPNANINQGNKDKAAMLSALNNLHQRLTAVENKG